MKEMFSNVPDKTPAVAPANEYSEAGLGKTGQPGGNASRHRFVISCRPRVKRAVFRERDSHLNECTAGVTVVCKKQKVEWSDGRLFCFVF